MIKGWRLRIKSVGGLDVKLGSDDAGDFDGSAIGNRRAIFRTRRRGIARFAHDISDFAHAIFRNGRDDVGFRTDELRYVGFAGALRMAKHRAQEQVHQARHDQAAEQRERRADGRTAGFVKLRKNEAESAINVQANR